MSDKRVVSVTSAADLAAVSVSLIGSVPTDSIVLVPQGPDAPMVRVDAPEGGDVDGVTQALRSALEMGGGCPYVVVAFCGHDAAEAAITACERVEGADLPLCVRVEGMTARRRLGASVYDVAELVDFMKHPASREAVLSGALTLASHEEVGHLFIEAETGAGRGAEQMEAVGHACARLQWQAPTEAAAEVWETIRTVGDSDRALSTDEVALLVAAAESVPHRDAVMAASVWDLARAAGEAFRHAGQAVPGPWAGHAFTVAAVMYKGAEKSIHARHAADAGMRLAPANTLAPLIAQVIQLGVHPDEFRTLMSS